MTASLPSTAKETEAIHAPPTVRIAGARLDFGEMTLFEDLSLTLPAGTWTCLLGPSGVGKTSILRMIAGLEVPADGTSIEADDGAGLARRVAYMAQQDLLLPWLSVLDNVMLGARLRGEAPDPERAERLLAAVGLSRERLAFPRSLSGGQRQRAALARTLMEDRPLVLMDEPFSALDTISRLRLQTLAAELLQERTVLLVTHDPLEALRLGHQIHVLSGRPATLDQALKPEGRRPRDPGEPRLIALQAELIARLATATDGNS